MCVTDRTTQRKMLTICANGTLLDCCIAASPLLTTMSKTLIPLNRDDDMNIVIDDFNVDDMKVYVNYCNTGTLIDDYNVDLFKYMCHDIDDNNIEYSRIRLMEEWNNKLTSDGTNGIVVLDTSPTNNRIGMLYPFIKDYDYCLADRSRSSIITIGLIDIEGDDTQDFMSKIDEMKRETLVTYSINTDMNIINVRFVDVHDYHYVIHIVNSLADFCHSVMSNVIYSNNVYHSLISKYLSSPTNYEYYVNQLYNEYIQFRSHDTTNTMTLIQPIIISKAITMHQSLYYNYTISKTSDTWTILQHDNSPNYITKIHILLYASICDVTTLAIDKKIVLPNISM